MESSPASSSDGCLNVPDHAMLNPFFNSKCLFLGDSGAQELHVFWVIRVIRGLWVIRVIRVIRLIRGFCPNQHSLATAQPANARPEPTHHQHPTRISNAQRQRTTNTLPESALNPNHHQHHRQRTTNTLPESAPTPPPPLTPAPRQRTAPYPNQRSTRITPNTAANAPPTPVQSQRTTNTLPESAPPPPTHRTQKTSSFHPRAPCSKSPGVLHAISHIISLAAFFCHFLGYFDLYGGHVGC